MSEVIIPTTIEGTIDRVRDRFMSIAERHQLVTWAEESLFALQACERNPDLLACSPVTVQDAILNVAAVGLTLNPAHQYAFLVPEYNKNANRKECVLRISFRGLIKIATDSGAVKWVKADVIHEADKFTYHGPNAMPEISMEPFGERGKPVGVYCIAKTHEDDFLVDTAPWSEVEKARNAAKTKYVWDAWPMEMAKKFIIKRASKQWPRTDRNERLSTAVDVLNRAEGSDPLLLEDDTKPRSTSVSSMVLDDIEIDLDALNPPMYAIRRVLQQYADEVLNMEEARDAVRDAEKGLGSDEIVALYSRFDSTERALLKPIRGQAWGTLNIEANEHNRAHGR